MFDMIRRVFGTTSGRNTHPTTATRSRRLRTSRPGVESLESRDCPSTVAEVAQAIVLNTEAAAQQLVHDVYVFESAQPTLAVNQIGRDLVALYTATRSGNIDAIFADAGQLLSDLQAEASLISARHMRQISPLSYIAVQTDFRNLAVDYRLANELVLYVQQQYQAQQAQQLQQQFQVPPISVSQQSIQQSQAKISQINNLEAQQASIYNSDWVNSFNTGVG